MNKKAGILLPIISLPSAYGIGCFSKEAYDFLDWLKASGQSYWQILPLGPTGYGDSPYQSFSAFAGNPYLICLETLIEEGFLTKAECDSADFGDGKRIDYGKLYNSRFILLKKAYNREKNSLGKEYSEFLNENSYWLTDYALFMAIKNHFSAMAMQDWDKEILMREEKAVEKYRAMLQDEIEFQKYMQFKFFTQWSKLLEYAHSKGIRIIGDIPIYTSPDSADVWANPKLFLLDAKMTPTHVAGCPPDDFSPNGQLWGNPLYNWEYHKSTDYLWWIKRIEHCFKLYDVVRIDHFRGFDEFYAIAYGSTDAIKGEWKKGPGKLLFQSIEKALGKKDIIAEDLGFITDSVRTLLKECDFPSMKVLEFAFDTRGSDGQSDHMPHNFPEKCVAYTATHDNSTLRSWFNSISEHDRRRAREYLCDFYTPDEKLNMPFISLVLRSSADLVIIPLQDYMALDDSARINTPATMGENWKWRLDKNEPGEMLAKNIRSMVKLFGRS